MGGTPRYGVDGLPYVVGLSGASVTFAAIAAAVRHRAPRPATAALLAGVATGVPAGLGWRYAAFGKPRLRDRLLAQVDWRGDEVVVDLGAGSGLLALGAAQRTTGPVHAVDLFIGKDLSGNSPERLRRNAELLDVADRLRVHREDVRNTGLPDGCADVVFSSLCIHNVPQAGQREQALAEAVRLLSPGGTIVLSDLAHVDDEYTPFLEGMGLRVRTERLPATFPPQRLLVARSA